MICRWQGLKISVNFFSIIPAIGPERGLDLLNNNVFCEPLTFYNTIKACFYNTIQKRTIQIVNSLFLFKNPILTGFLVIDIKG